MLKLCQRIRTRISSLILGPTLTGPPTPIEAETGAMPADDGVWVYNDERFGPAGPELLQQDPEQSIRRTQAGSRPFPLEDPKF